MFSSKDEMISTRIFENLKVSEGGVIWAKININSLALLKRRENEKNRNRSAVRSVAC